MIGIDTSVQKHFVFFFSHHLNQIQRIEWDDDPFKGEPPLNWEWVETNSKNLWFIHRIGFSKILFWQLASAVVSPFGSDNLGLVWLLKFHSSIEWRKNTIQKWFPEPIYQHLPNGYIKILLHNSQCTKYQKRISHISGIKKNGNKNNENKQ